jgi:ectoine hydroxylase-related dioxygenase (phytanoyl-CoA dioxygenase family)
MEPFAESNEMLGDAAALRRRAQMDGYLFFRNLVDQHAVREVRREFVRIVHRHGWLDEGADPDDCITSQPPRIEGMAEFWPVFTDFQRLECFHALAHTPAILDMLESVLGEPVLVHPRNIGRIIFPTTPPTPPHQDYVHIQGTPDVWTAWIPLGDVSREMSGLAVLPGTHREGVYPVRRMPGAGGVGVDTDGLGATWVASDFRIGDALFFHSHTVHKGLPHTAGNRIRLSVDYRYQGVSKPITEGSLLPHFNRFSWDFVYQGWRSKRYQYYWTDLPLDVVGFDRGVYRSADERSAGTQGRAY